MQELIRAGELARALGISRYTVRDWCRRDPELAIRKNGMNYVRVRVLATKPGMDMIQALLVPHQRWVKTTDMARLAGISRKTVNNWCRSRPWFACRIGRTWYLNLTALDASPEEMDFLKKMAPRERVSARILESAGELGQNLTESGE